MTSSLVRFWDRLPIVGRLLVTASLALLVAALSMLYSTVRNEAGEARTDLQEQLKEELQSMPPALSEVLVIGDYASLQQTLDRKVRRPQIVKVAYLDSSGARLESDNQPMPQTAPAWFVAWLGLHDLTGEADVVIGGRHYGSLEVTLTSRLVANRLWRHMNEHLLVLLLAIALDSLGIWLVLRSGLRPLETLSAAATAMAGGDLRIRAEPAGSPELRNTIDAFNHMAQAVEEASQGLILEKERLQVTLASIGDAVITTDRDGRVEFINPVAEALTGWSNREARDRPILEVFDIISEMTRGRAENPIERVFREGRVVGLANHTLLIARDGTERPIADSAAPIRAGPHGEILGAILVFRDQTHERKYLDRLRENEQRLNTILDNVEAYIYIKDTDYRYQYANRRVRELFGAELDRIVGQTDSAFFDAAAAAKLRENDRRVLESGERVELEEKNISRRTGETRTYLSVKIPLRREDGSVYALCGVSTDITARIEAEDRLRLSGSVFEHAQEGIMITDSDAVILNVNPAFTELTGYEPAEVIGRTPAILSSGHHHPDFYAEMWAALMETGQWRGEIWNRKKNGELYAELLAITAVPSEEGGKGYFVGVFSDITELKSHQQHLERIAHYDALTQLPNRVLLADRLHVALAQARRSGGSLAVCYLDLDGFKPVNDKLGHEAGDRLLVDVASRLTMALRAGDTVARLGGDEFVLLLQGLHDAEECEQTLARLLKAVAKPYDVDGHTIEISASVGVSLYPYDDTDPDTLLRHADQAMYAAKEGGRNRYHLFDPEHDRRARAHREAVARIEEALDEDEFVLFYQPKVDMHSGKVVGAEALIRWVHPLRGLLPPAEFLPFVENTEFSVRLGEWVIEQALSQIEAWRLMGIELPVSVNISARHLQQPDMTARLAEALARHPAVPPRHFELEILETSALDDILHVTHLIEECQRLGVSFALDDFGTGYSSLSYFKRLPAETLKIDQSFVRDMLRDTEDLAIVEGVIGLADAFQRKVIAEGVETVAHGVLLLHLGCKLAQGYGIARPMPADAMPEWIAGWRPDPRWTEAPGAGFGRQELPLLVAEFDHENWMAGVSGWLRAEPDQAPAPPSLDERACLFERWLDGAGRERYGDSPTYGSVRGIRHRIAALVRELVTLKQSGQAETARGRLGELEALNQEMLTNLMRLHHGAGD